MNPLPPTITKAQLKSIPATITILAICVVVFIVKFALDTFAPGSDAQLTYQVQGLWVPGIVLYGRWWTVLTSMFMHSSFFHLLCNMISLYYLGTLIERLYGTVRFLVLYFASGLVGGLFYLWMNYSVNAYAVGASGAIFGLFGACGILLILEYRKPLLLNPQSTKQALTAFLGLLVVNLLMSFQPGIAWQAHVGGLVTGAVIGFFCYRWLRNKRLAQMAQITHM